MSRLQSLQAVSPRRSPTPSSPPPTTSPYPQDTTTFHRKLRALLVELRNTMMAWDEMAGDGLREARSMVNEGTEIDNILVLPEGPSRPSISSHWTAYHSHSTALQGVLNRQRQALQKLRLLADTASSLLFEAVKLRDPEFSLMEPMWNETGTWTLERFVNETQPIPTIFSTHSLLLSSYTNTITSPPQSLAASDLFDVQSTALESYLNTSLKSDMHTWREEWVEMVGLEIGGWEVRGDVGVMGGLGKGRRAGRAGSVEPMG